MMNRVFCILFCSFALTATPKLWAKADVTEDLNVQKIKWNRQKKMYGLTLYGKSGVYYAPRSWLPCLRDSLQKNREVRLSYTLKDLVIKSCQKIFF
ncbi:MAG: hypothetical protein OXB88_08560 [Bacteriovoracales bacterium]|nr:hypothetical protein [Bacteriovoracales bacterium]